MHVRTPNVPARHPGPREACWRPNVFAVNPELPITCEELFGLVVLGERMNDQST